MRERICSSRDSAKAPGSSTPTAFLDIHLKVLSGGERGLLGLAFHPLYSTNRRFFVYYTRTGDRVASCTSTDEEVQALHRAFSVEMSREVRALAALEPLGRASWTRPRSGSPSARLALHPLRSGRSQLPLIVVLPRHESLVRSMITQEDL